ncbi:hypothetical protein BV20DRAFT_1058546, partial [Pilatotrama ljubarskyi]
PPSGSTGTKVDTAVVAPLVLHPRTLFPLSFHLPSRTGSSGVNSAARLPKPPRSQRRDAKKPRRCPVTNPHDKPPRGPKRGVTSACYLLEHASHIEDADCNSDNEEPAQKRAKYTLTDGPIDGFV